MNEIRKKLASHVDIPHPHGQLQLLFGCLSNFQVCVREWGLTMKDLIHIEFLRCTEDQKYSPSSCPAQKCSWIREIGDAVVIYEMAYESLIGGFEEPVQEFTGGSVGWTS